MNPNPILTPFALDRMFGEIAGDRARLDIIRSMAEGRVPYLAKSGEVKYVEALRSVSVGGGATSIHAGHEDMALPTDGHAWIELGPNSLGFTN
ncbi:hypothetical protein EKD04_009535 [Chloroflexales bacterium ZM16-3]|nr:hypothetical protein [Chloroflexales bacterium ZM16-3]